ncbi:MULTISPECIES: type 1 glutamine amidotransferase domain-containing protein [Pseudomonas]|uniref:type 1 glutamine amidotransferase domain-containing protein n=1 Tax=Pseudomonas TaxID=286 RepID=UPI0004423F00|nr:MULTISPECIES: type 1 glutamine amidotransferase domain-containing protein [Pseudomonas]MBP5117494.1 DJ-1/PfpI family protein [Pseudomonas protegens]MCS4259285.1 putative intracellular protease/amidase [Pseudomonas sp. BIGb0176]QTU19783.1 DJ-1/PfpI family protein [Pseudomonas protegens]ROQ56446.1 putative intracellular protease/amidase [Pseudomonas protegens]ROQ85455.1 putative intracellular protease/amidase [Pseudomonas protegens]
MILILLPHADYDPSESSLPWQAARDAGFAAQFATPLGMPAYADSRLVSLGFGPLNPLLMTPAADLARYHAMTRDPAFCSPLPYAGVDPAAYEGLLIPGGHARGMRSLLESEEVRRIILAFFQADKPVAAVCHGPLALARCIDPASGRSVLHGRKVTALLAGPMELAAWLVTAPWLGRYYRTYDHSVEEEIKAALASPADFLPGPWLPRRDSAEHPERGFVVRDRNLLTARWPGDCHRFANEWASLLQQARDAQPQAQQAER